MIDVVEVKDNNIKTKVLEIIQKDIDGSIKIIKSFIYSDLDTPKSLTGKEKMAMLLIIVGLDISTLIMKQLTEEEIEILCLELAMTRLILSECQESILTEFYQCYIAQQYILEGGLPFAKKLLENSFGENKAFDIISRLTVSIPVMPFDWIRSNCNESEICRLLVGEDLETIALVLSQLRPHQASSVFNDCSIEEQLKIVKYLSTVDFVDLDDVKEVEIRLTKKAQSILMNNSLLIDGINTVVEILTCSSRDTEKRLLEELKKDDEILYTQIHDKIFVFEDILCLTNNDIGKVLNSSCITDEDLIMALKGQSEDLTTLILQNLPEERKIMIKYRIKQSQPAYLKNVIAAQQKIVAVVYDLQEKDEILIARGYGDEIVV